MNKNNKLLGFDLKESLKSPKGDEITPRPLLKQIVDNQRGSGDENTNPLKEDVSNTLSLEDEKVNKQDLSLINDESNKTKENEIRNSDQIKSNKSQSKSKVSNLGEWAFSDYFRPTMSTLTVYKNVPISLDNQKMLKLLAAQNDCSLMSLVNNIFEEFKLKNGKEINDAIKKTML